MQSALEAILKAVALERQVNIREINGLLYKPEGVIRGFILFDDSAGGGGAVLPLVLTGNHELDQNRHKDIHNIINRAIDICVNCDECNKQVVFAELRDDQIPLKREDYLTTEISRDRCRVRQSCYHCLRSYRNQRLHALLDRKDAVIVLQALLEHKLR